MGACHFNNSLSEWFSSKACFVGGRCSWCRGKWHPRDVSKQDLEGGQSRAHGFLVRGKRPELPREGLKAKVGAHGFLVRGNLGFLGACHFYDTVFLRIVVTKKFWSYFAPGFESSFFGVRFERSGDATCDETYA